jgi:N6-L-threonylcarbamoyladenine synthase
VHEQYGGVVPELASRDHQRLIVPVVEEALEKAGVTREELNGVAVTYGPGLAGSLLVGLSFAKALAYGLDIPLIGVNHLEGHVYSVFLEETVPEFPFLCLVVSGGHTQVVRVAEGFQHEVLGRTRDDAAGEAFDKVAKMLGLGYPGGPKIDALARTGDAGFYSFPRSKVGKYDFSFSGLKTSVLYYLNQFDEDERSRHLDGHLNDLCASFQQAVVDMLLRVVHRAVTRTGIRQVAVVGGVSANQALRTALRTLGEADGFSLYIPSPRFCTDNAAMIAVTGYHKLGNGLSSPLTLTAAPSLRIS